MRAEPRLTLDDLDRRFQAFILDVYQVQPHSETHLPPGQRWRPTASYPRCPTPWSNWIYCS